MNSLAETQDSYFVLPVTQKFFEIIKDFVSDSVCSSYLNPYRVRFTCSFWFLQIYKAVGEVPCVM